MIQDRVTGMWVDPLTYTAREMLRHYIINHELAHWGFPIVRCTYSSQQDWDRFISIIQDEAVRYLGDYQDVNDKMVWTVIEDPALESADYVAASKRFGDWVDRDLKFDDSDSDEENYVRVKDFTVRQQAERGWQPRHQFFIDVDEEVLRSVIDHPYTPINDISGVYFIKLVSFISILQREERRAAQQDNSDEVYEEEEDESDTEYTREFWQKFKAFDVVRLYAAILQGCWPDFLETFDGHGDITNNSMIKQWVSCRICDSLGGGLIVLQGSKSLPRVIS